MTMRPMRADARRNRDRIIEAAAEAFAARSPTPAWLDASADDPDVAAFTAMQATASPPAPRVVNETCSRVLWARFRSAGIGST